MHHPHVHRERLEILGYQIISFASNPCVSEASDSSFIEWGVQVENKNPIVIIKT